MKWGVAFLALLTLSACTVKPQPEVVQPILLSETPVEVRTETETATKTVYPTQSPFPTATATIPPTATPSFSIETINLQIDSDVSGRDLQGRIALRGTNYSSTHQYRSYIWDLDEDFQREIIVDPDQAILAFSISPDRQTLAIYLWGSSIHRNVLNLINFQGELLTSQDITTENWSSLVGWADNKHIIFSKNIYLDHLQRPGPTVIVDPYTLEIVKEFSTSDYPDAAIWVPPTNWDGYSAALAVYNPDFRQVVYLRDGLRITLYDIEQEEIVIVLRPGDYTGPPRWTTDGAYFYIDMYTDSDYDMAGFEGEELFQISKEGVVKRLTYLYDIAEEANITHFVLSPDEEKIIFWLNTDPAVRENRLAVLDISAERVEIYENITAPFYGNPVWSPDSQQVMIANEYEKYEERYRTILIDFKEGFAVELARDAIPMGWLYDDTP